MHGWHCYIFKTYPPDKLSKLRTTGFDSQPEGLGVAFFATGSGLGLINVYLHDTRISFLYFDVCLNIVQLSV